MTEEEKQAWLDVETIAYLYANTGLYIQSIIRWGNDSETRQYRIHHQKGYDFLIIA
jgi:hypothetical protein